MLPPEEPADSRSVDDDADNARMIPPRSDERRRLLRGTLAAAPVLMTVASKPVLGSTRCLAPSAMGSMNPSGNATRAAVCSGLTPTQWKAHAAQWPSPYCATAATAATSSNGRYEYATLYHCPTTGLNGRVFGDRTMLEVIDIGESGGGATSLGRYIVAALLNARAGRTPVLDETGVRQMWNDTVNRGYYEPTAGVRWGPAEIIAYLKTTMS